VEHLPEQWEDLPATLFANFHILNNQSSSYPYYLLGRGVSGVSAANLLGRFAYCNEEVNSLVKEIADFEKNYYIDYIVVQISSIPDSRLGNIPARSSFREKEILYLTNSTRDRDVLINRNIKPN